MTEGIALARRFLDRKSRSTIIQFVGAPEVRFTFYLPCSDNCEQQSLRVWK
jgi:hypothetical protein